VWKMSRYRDKKTKAYSTCEIRLTPWIRSAYAGSGAAAYFCAAVPVDGPHEGELGQDVGDVRSDAEYIEGAHG
jgi:hypothetical protein